MRNRRDPLDNPALSGLRDALTAEPTADELQGEHQVLTAYRAVSWDRRWTWHRPAIFATKLGVATAAGVLALSGVATAAYTGSLPDALQEVAHKTIKAPAAHPPTQAVGPDATGPAAYGLCQAFAKEKDDEAKQARKEAERAAERAAEGASPKAVPPGQAKKAEKAAQGKGSDQAGDRGQSKQKSVAYRNLVRAAGGEDKVEAYCASVAKPSESSKPSEQSSSPKPKPTQAATGKPSAKPTQAADGKPTELPAPAKSHRPTGSPQQPTP